MKRSGDPVDNSTSKKRFLDPTNNQKVGGSLLSERNDNSRFGGHVNRRGISDRFLGSNRSQGTARFQGRFQESNDRQRSNEGLQRNDSGIQRQNECQKRNDNFYRDSGTIGRNEGTHRNDIRKDDVALQDHNRCSSSNKFSANERLRNYRKTLQDKIGQVVKPHTIISRDSCSSDNRIARDNPANDVRDRCTDFESANPRGIRSNINKFSSPPPKQETKADSNKRTIEMRDKEDVTVWRLRQDDSPNSSTIRPGNYSDCNDARISDLEESSMDWEPIDEKIIINNINEMRKDEQKIQRPTSIIIPDERALSTSINDLYIVVDTNVFLSKLSVVKHLSQMKIKGVKAPIVYIPYQVLSELDYIKDGRIDRDCQLNASASRAINFIADTLDSREKRIQGQGVQDCLNNKILSSNGDDGILAAAIQVLETKGDAILLTNDTNLRNKASFSGVKACHSDEILDFLETMPVPISSKQEDVLIDDVKSEFSNLVSFILSKRLDETCGDAWKKKVRCEPPWTVEECLRILKQFWSFISVVPTGRKYSIDGLQKHCRRSIEKFQEFLKSSQRIVESHEIKTLIEYCLDICMHLRNGFPTFDKNIIKCTDEIQAIAKKLGF